MQILKATASRTAAALATILAAGLGGAAALAEPPASTTAQSSGGLGEIVVTAQKRKENLQSVPVSITAISASQLLASRVTNATQITQQVPNLSVQTPYGDAQPVFSLRGVSLVDYSQHQQGPIAMYVDEDYKGAGVFRAQQLFDVDRVEVLRGPQGTLFGRNTTGGSINIYTVSPNLQGTRGFVTAGVGNYGLKETSGAIEFTPIKDVLGVRIAYDYRRTDGFIKALQPGLDPFNNENGGGVRVKVDYHPSSRLKFELTYAHGQSATNATGYTAEFIGPDGIAHLGLFNPNEPYYASNAGNQGYIDIVNDTVQLRGEYNISDAVTLTSLSSYDRGRFKSYADDDDRPENILGDGVNSLVRDWSQELRLASSTAGPFTWLVGGAYSGEHINTSSRYDYYALLAKEIDGQPSCLVDQETGCIYLNAFDTHRRSAAAFAHLTYELAEGLQIQGGLRYSNDQTVLNDYTSTLGYYDPTTGAAVLNSDVHQIAGPPFHSFTNQNVSGKFVVRYEFMPRVSVYASYSRGYRSGTFNGYAYYAPSEVNIVKPETLDSYEFGFKGEFLDRKLRVNGAIFYYNYKDQQFLNVNELGLETLVNAPKSRIWGGELEITAVPTRTLSFHASVGHTNAVFRELTLEGEDLSGNRLPSAPNWTLNGAIDWTILQDSPGQVDLHVDTRYTSKQYFDAFNADQSSQPAYWLVDASLSKPLIGKKLTASIWAKNILGQRYNAYSLGDGAVNAQEAVRGAPRTYGGSLTYTF
jgi:iron complex outermembrane recepter protein